MAVPDDGLELLEDLPDTSIPEALADKISSGSTAATVDDLATSLAALEDSLPSADIDGDRKLPYDYWEALAYDLASDNASPYALCEAYGISISQLQSLQANPYFSKLLSAKREEIKGLGSSALQAVKFRVVLNKALPHYLSRLLNPATQDKDFHNMFRTAAELARVFPDKSVSPITSTASAPSIVFNIQGVPGLDHISASTMASTSSQPMVIDATPSQPDEGEGR